MLNTDKYWMLKKLIHDMPYFETVKKLTIKKGHILYGNTEIANQSPDNSMSIIHDQRILKKMGKDNQHIFFSDFMSLSQMTYFILTYVLNPVEPKKAYRDSWRNFKSRVASPEQIVSLNNQKTSLLQLSYILKKYGSLNDKESASLKSRSKPPIFSSYAVIFHRDGREFKCLHYTVISIANPGEHISVVLIETSGKKYYKLSVRQGKNDIELFDEQEENSEYLTFNFDDFKEYTDTSEFMAKFSMKMIKSAYPQYNENHLPNQRDKIIFDMMGY